MKTLILRYDKKTGMVHKEGSNWKVKLGERLEVPIDWDDLVTKGKVGFDALHEKLAGMAVMYHFALEPFLEQLATTSIVRLVHCVRDHKMPPYVVQEVFRLLVEAKACIREGAALRKTISYVDFLRIVVTVEPTAASVTTRQKKHEYIFPSNFDEMSMEMLGEELRDAEEKDADEKVMTKLRKLFHAAQRQATEKKFTTKSGKKMTEDERMKVIMAEEAAEQKAAATQHAEYDDMPPTKKRRK